MITYYIICDKITFHIALPFFLIQWRKGRTQRGLHTLCFSVRVAPKSSGTGGRKSCHLEFNEDPISWDVGNLL